MRTLPDEPSSDQIDAEDTDIEQVRVHPAVQDLADRFDRIGLDVQPVPASLAPSAEMRGRVSSWEVQVEGERPVICVGMTATCTPAEVCFELAGVLAERMVPAARQGDPAQDALVAALSMRICVEVGEPDLVFGERNDLLHSATAAELGLTTADEAELPLRAWALLQVFADDSFRSELKRVSPTLAARSQQLMAATGAPLPDDETGLHRATSALRRALEGRVTTRRRIAARPPRRPRR